MKQYINYTSYTTFVMRQNIPKHAAVVYLRSTNDNGEVYLACVAAKTKVAPVKYQPMPRLELCGTLILPWLLRKCATVLNLKRNLSMRGYITL